MTSKNEFERILANIRDSKTNHFHLNQKFLTFQQLQELTKLLKTNQVLTSFHLTYSGIEEEETELIAELLLDNRFLTNVSLGGNQIADGGAKAIARALESNQFLTRIDLGHNQISDDGAEAIGKALAINDHLTSIDLGSNKIGNHGIKAIAKALETNRALTYINLGFINITDGGAKAIAIALNHNQNLTAIYLNNSRISGNDIKSIAESLKTNKTLTYINLEGSSATGDCGIAIGEALQINQTLTGINLKDAGIGDDGAKAIFKALESNQTLYSINLVRTNGWGNTMSHVGAKAIGDGLAINRSLGYIYLAGQKIGNKGVEAIVKGLFTNQSLINIDLLHNNIGDDGAKAIAKVLETNQALTHIDLSSNEITDDGVKAIAKALETNQTLTSIKFRDNKITDDGVKAIAKALETNQALTHIDLSGNEITDDAVKAIAKALEINQTLANIKFGGNKITDDGVKAIAKALETNQALTHIEFRGKKISDDGITEILQALQTNTILIHLDIYSNHSSYEVRSQIQQLLSRNYRIREEFNKKVKDVIEEILASNFDRSHLDHLLNLIKQAPIAHQQYVLERIIGKVSHLYHQDPKLNNKKIADNIKIIKELLNLGIKIDMSQISISPHLRSNFEKLFTEMRLGIQAQPISSVCDTTRTEDMIDNSYNSSLQPQITPSVIAPQQTEEESIFTKSTSFTPAIILASDNQIASINHEYQKKQQEFEDELKANQDKQQRINLETSQRLESVETILKQMQEVQIAVSQSLATSSTELTSTIATSPDFSLNQQEKRTLEGIFRNYELAGEFASSKSTAKFYLPGEQDLIGQQRINERIARIQNNSTLTKFYIDLKYYLNEVFTSAMIADVIGISRKAVMGRNVIDMTTTLASFAVDELPGGSAINFAISALTSYYPDKKFADNYRKLTRLCGDGGLSLQVLIENLALEITDIFVEEQKKQPTQQQFQKQGFDKICHKAKQEVQKLSPNNHNIELKLSQIDEQAAFYGTKLIASIFNQKLDQEQKYHRAEISRDIIDNLVSNLKSEIQIQPEKPKLQSLNLQAVQKAQEMQQRRGGWALDMPPPIMTPRTQGAEIIKLQLTVKAQAEENAEMKQRLEAQEKETEQLKAMMRQLLAEKQGSLSARREARTPRGNSDSNQSRPKLIPELSPRQTVAAALTKKEESKTTTQPGSKTEPRKSQSIVME